MQLVGIEKLWNFGCVDTLSIQVHQKVAGEGEADPSNVLQVTVSAVISLGIEKSIALIVYKVAKLLLQVIDYHSLSSSKVLCLVVVVVVKVIVMVTSK